MTTTAIPKPAANVNLVGLAKTDYKSAPSTLCNGCGHDSIASQIIAVPYDLSLAPHRLAKFSGIGCSSKSPAYFLGRSHTINGLHGRMPSLATGALTVNRELIGLGVSGDGDTGSIGFGQFKHMLRRNVDMVGGGMTPAPHVRVAFALASLPGVGRRRLRTLLARGVGHGARTAPELADEIRRHGSDPGLHLGSVTGVDEAWDRAGALVETCQRISREIAKVIVRQDAVVEQLLIAILARGHCLLEGVPGLAKNLMVRVLSRVMELSFRRIQFTPDLMPADITGTDVIHEDPATGRRELTFLEVI